MATLSMFERLHQGEEDEAANSDEKETEGGPEASRLPPAILFA